MDMASCTWAGPSTNELALVMPRVRRLVSRAATRFRRQEVSARACTRFASVAPTGRYSSVKDVRWSWYACKSSVGMTTNWPVRPWRSAFRELRCLPAAVLGPVECCALALLVSLRDVDDIVSSAVVITARGRGIGRVEVGGD